MSLSSLKVWSRHLSVSVCRGLLRAFSRRHGLIHAPTLILAPHQDDETLACGGLIARHRDRGREVHVAFLTNGDASHPNHPLLSASELVALRYSEAMQALGVLGVDSACVYFLNEPDGSLKSLLAARRAALVERIAGLVGRIRPGRIFVPCSPDGSSEHDPVLGLAVDALDQTGLNAEIWQYPVWSWWNPPLLLRTVFRAGDAHRLAGEDYQVLK